MYYTYTRRLLLFIAWVSPGYKKNNLRVYNTLICHINTMGEKREKAHRLDHI